MQGIDKVTSIHIATELILIGGISLFFHKKVEKLNQRIGDLEKKIQELESAGSSLTGGKIDSVEDKFNQFYQQTVQQITSLHSIVREMKTSNSPLKDKNHPPRPPTQPLSKPDVYINPDLYGRINGGKDFSNIRGKSVSIEINSIPIPRAPENIARVEVVEDDEDEEEINDEEILEELAEDLQELNTDVKDKEAPSKPELDLEPELKPESKPETRLEPIKENTCKIIEENKPSSIMDKVKEMEKEREALNKDSVLEFVTPVSKKKRTKVK